MNCNEIRSNVTNYVIDWKQKMHICFYGLQKHLWFFLLHWRIVQMRATYCEPNRCKGYDSEKKLGKEETSLCFKSIENDKHVFSFAGMVLNI